VDRGLALVATLAVGALIAFQPPANAALARHVGDLGAAFTSLFLSALIAGVILVVAGDAGELRHLDQIRPEHLVGAIGGVAIVTVSLIAVRSLGVAGVTAALVATQLITSALIDRYGLLGVKELPLTSARLVGIGLLMGGTLLVTWR
jgi:transporter family-2 protein